MEYLRCKCTQAVQCFIPAKMRTHGKHSKDTITKGKLARLGHFLPDSQAGRLAGPVIYVYVFSLVQEREVRLLAGVSLCA